MYSVTQCNIPHRKRFSFDKKTSRKKSVKLAASESLQSYKSASPQVSAELRCGASRYGISEFFASFCRHVTRLRDDGNHA